ncbi:MAG TPA: hypothetical protein VKR42_14465, partial [Ktedonobacteraceae bacterium]|nr:hypothetical protein [Ktedonobacteraceae bacterium]
DIHPLPFSNVYRNISSTQVRQHSSEYMHDVPHEVQRFMRKTRAYASPQRLPDGTEIDYYGERVKVLQALLRNADCEKSAYSSQSVPRRLR